MKEIILATSNPGKIKELQTLLNPVRCIGQQTLGITNAEETGLSFIENALLKARHASRIGKKPALADDSGLVVPALNGEPGIYSARYAGVEATDENNINQLLNKLKHLDNLKRQAYFYCAIALVRHENDPTPIIATGELSGFITDEPQGTHGFGYDPIFYLSDYKKTMAELEAPIKNTISHRAKAMKQLLSYFNLKQ